MTPETIVWLCNKVSGYQNLNDEERNLISDFSMLWSLFECSELGANGSIKKIKEFAEKLEKKGVLSALNLDEYLAYLKNRYYVNGEFTEEFHHLHIERSGKPPEIIQTLSNNETELKTQVIGCLAIVFRLRNNLFHGVKWQYDFFDQKNNFVYANTFLRSIMTI